MVAACKNSDLQSCALNFKLSAKTPTHCCSICSGSRHRNCTPLYTSNTRVNHKLPDADIMTSRMGVLFDTVILTLWPPAILVPSALIPLSMHC